MITLKETLNCLENTEVNVDQSLAIIGTGPVAQALTLFASLKNIEPIVVFGRHERWADIFSNLGAHAYVSGPVFPAYVKNILASGGFDRVIEAVGAREALKLGLKITSSNGRINLYGIPPVSKPYSIEEENDPRVFRSRVAEAEAHDQLLTWVSAHRIVLSEWITNVLPWTEYESGFGLVKSKSANKVVLSFI